MTGTNNVLRESEGALRRVSNIVPGTGWGVFDGPEANLMVSGTTTYALRASEVSSMGLRMPDKPPIYEADWGIISEGVVDREGTAWIPDCWALASSPRPRRRTAVPACWAECWVRPR